MTAESQKEPCAERLQAAVAHAQVFLEARSAAADARFSREIVALLCGAAHVADVASQDASGAGARTRPAEMFGAAAARKVLSERVAALLAVHGSVETGQAAPSRAIFDLFALADALGVLRAPEIAPLVGMLTKAQRTDGAWVDEQGEVSLVLTGMFGGYLARTFQARPSVLAEAERYLASCWAPARVSGDINLCWDALVAFAHFYAVNGDDLADEVLQRCGRELERGDRSQVLQPLDLAYVLLLCDAEAFPALRRTGAEILQALVAAQREDGGWPGARCTRGDDESATVLALVAIQRWKHLAR